MEGFAVDDGDHLALGQFAGRKRPDVRGIARWAAARKKVLSPTCDVGGTRGRGGWATKSELVQRIGRAAAGRAGRRDQRPHGAAHPRPGGRPRSGAVWGGGDSDALLYQERRHHHAAGGG